MAEVTKGKRGPAAAKATWDGTVLSHKWSDGIVTTFDYARVSADTVTMATRNGFKQKLGDAYAIEKDDNGQSATIAQKREAYIVVRDNLYADKWVADRESGGEMRGYVFDALVQLLGDFPVAKFDEMVAADAEKQGVSERRIIETTAARKDVAPIIAKIKEARGIKLPDSNSLLAALKASLKA